MLKRLNEKVSLKTVIWLFPLVFLIHDGEELLTIESWLGNRREVLMERLGSFANGILAGVTWTTPRFAAAIAVLFVLVCWVSFAAARSLRPSKGVNGFVAVLTVLFLNVFTHSAQAVAVRGYTPGIVTALLVALPYTLYTFHRLLLAGLLSRRAVTLTLWSAPAVFVGLVGLLLLP